MALTLRLRQFKEISRLLRKVCNGRNGGKVHLHLRWLSSRQTCWSYNYGEFQCRGLHIQRYSTLPTEILNDPLPDSDFLSFIQSTLDENEGCSHRWFNISGDCKSSFRKDGVFLIVAGRFIGDSLKSDCNHLMTFGKVKSLKQRHPSLQIIGFQYTPSISLETAHTHLLWRIMTEYITFPVLLSNKFPAQMKGGACYFLFKGFESPTIYHDKAVDLTTLDKAVKILTMVHDQRPTLVNKLDSPWVNPIQIVKEPHQCLHLRNLFLYCPGCISVDEDGKRLFLSDSNHHRILIFDRNAKILDAIGSSPGFEDADFENAKLMRPAASFYHAPEDCLFFVDSEICLDMLDFKYQRISVTRQFGKDIPQGFYWVNHAIRRADMERRVVETIYPTNISKKNANLWSWLLDKFLKKKLADTKAEEFPSDSMLFPWHLLKSSNDDLFILNRSFDTLWIMDMASGIMAQVVKGFPRVMEACGQMITEKLSVVKRIPNDWLQQEMDLSWSLDGIPQAGLISSVAKLKDDIIFCDAVGQMVFKLNEESGRLSSFHFSNFGILGLPYWLSFPLERVCAGNEVLSEMHIDHIESFCLLPGKVKILVKVAVPEDVDHVEPLGRSSIWCRARGTAIEISGAESKAEFSEKVGVAQQWYDEIDHLTFTTSEKESSTPVEETTAPKGELQEGRICFDCTVATSPGASEVIIYAPLYLRLKKGSSPSSKNRAESAARIADILDPMGRPTRDSVIQFLMTSKREMEELIFVKGLHLRLKFDSRDHPKDDNSKGVVLTDSSVEVNVDL